MRNQASPFHLSRVIRCNISKSIPPFGGHPFHPFLGGTSVPSILFLGGTSVPAFLRLSLTACSATGPKQVFRHWPRVFCLNHFHCHRVIFIPALVWIRGSLTSRSIGRLSELHWFVTSTSVFLVESYVMGDFPGLCKWATARGPPHETTLVPVVHTSLFPSKAFAGSSELVLLRVGRLSGGLDLIHPCETVQTSCARVLSQLNCFCHHLDVKISGSILDWRNLNSSSEMDDLHSFLSIWLGVHRGSSWTSPFGTALVLTLVSSVGSIGRGDPSASLAWSCEDTFSVGKMAAESVHPPPRCRLFGGDRGKSPWNLRGWRALR